MIADNATEVAVLALFPPPARCHSVAAILIDWRETVRESRKFRGLLALVFCILPIFARASAIVEIGGIEILEDRYAEKVITANIYYDGSLGETAGVGVLAHTDEPVSSSAYHPYYVKAGNNKIRLNVTRPAVKGDISFESHSLQFKVYPISGRGTRKEMVEYALSWPSISEYFDFGAMPLTETPYDTVTSISIDEGLGDIAPLVRDAHAGGIEVSNINIFYSAMRPTALNATTAHGEQAALSVPETTSLSDLKRLAGSLARIGVEKLEFRPIPIDAMGFELGRPVLSDPALIHGLHIEMSELLALTDEASQAALYARAGFEDFDREAGYDRLLDKAIALNEEQNRNAYTESRKITEFLISVGYENSRVYSVLASAHCCHYKTNEDAVRARKAILNLGLSVNPEDQWIHALLSWDEALRGDFESAERHAKLAIKYAKEENVWNISNYGRIYALQGRNEEAREKYDALRGLENLSPPNQRAHRVGLEAYIDVLIALNDPLAGQVYGELIAAYPDETACKRLEYAAYLAAKEPGTENAHGVLADRNAQECEGYVSVAAFLDVLDWYRNSEPEVALRRALMRHEDMGLLLYSVATVAEGPDILAALGQRGVDLSTESANGFNTLHMAVLASNKVVLDASLEAGIDIDAISESGFSALMIAVYVENESMVRDLLARGARVDVQSTQGFTVLDMVAASTNDDMKALFKRSST